MSDKATWIDLSSADTSIAGVFEISNSGATITCKYCGTQYDNWAVDVDDYVPAVGDGCDKCSIPSEVLEAYFFYHLDEGAR